MMRTKTWFFGLALVGGVTGCGPDDSSKASDGGSSGTGGAAAQGGSSGTGGDSARGGSSGTGGGSNGTKPSGVTLFSMGYTSLQGIDTGSHEVVLDTTVTTTDVSASAMDTSPSKVWLARENGTVTVVDRASEKKLADVDVTGFASTPEESVLLPVVAAAADAGYTVLESYETISVLRIDGESFAVKAAPDVLDAVGHTTGMRVDGQNLWVLTGNAFELVKLDPKTLERRAAVSLGAPPDDAKAFGDYYGYGELAISPNAVFVLDDYTSRLIRVNKDSLEPNVADDLSDLELDTSLEFISRGGDVYLGLDEPGTVVRFDGTTGARIRSYELNAVGGSSLIDVYGSLLYLTPADASNHEALEFDADTGKTLQTITSQNQIFYPVIVR